MNEQGRFERYNEDPFREPFIKFSNPEVAANATTNEDGTIAETVPENTFTGKLSYDDLRKFEEDVYERKGCYLYFDKLPPPEEEDPKKAGGKAPAKKGAVEELKPVHGRVWIDLSYITHPGHCTIESR